MTYRVSDKRHSAAQHGFTLIELAMVISVIAMIVGGLMASASMVRSGELQNVGHELGDLQKGVNEFQELYAALPGDIPNATEIFRCTACNGNGNGRVDQDEQDLVLEHLSRAKLLKAELRASNAGNNKLFPESAASRGAIIAIEARPAANPDRLVAVVRMANEGDGTGPLAPQEAQSIDRRMDDGDPYNGRIVVEPASGAAADACKTGGQYVATGSSGRCNLAAVILGKAFNNAVDKTHEYQWIVQPKPTVTNVGSWTEGAWGECSQSCGGGIATRSVTCNPGTAQIDLTVRCVNIIDNTTASAETLCVGPKPNDKRSYTGCLVSTGTPATQKTCNDSVPCPHGWNTGGWTSCRDSSGTTIANGDWEKGNWGNCSAECGTGTQTRKIYCRERKGVRTRSVSCTSEATAACDGPRPPDTEECSVSTCAPLAASEYTKTCNEFSCDSGWKVTQFGDCAPPPAWSTSGWSSCKVSNTSTDAECGGPGMQSRTVTCTPGGVKKRNVTCPNGNCTGAAPADTEACDYSCAGERPTDVSICYKGARWGDVYNSHSQLFRFVDDATDGWVGCMTQ